MKNRPNFTAHSGLEYFHSSQSSSPDLSLARPRCARESMQHYRHFGRSIRSADAVLRKPAFLPLTASHPLRHGAMTTATLTATATGGVHRAGPAPIREWAGVRVRNMELLTTRERENARTRQREKGNSKNRKKSVKQPQKALPRKTPLPLFRPKIRKNTYRRRWQLPSYAFDRRRRRVE